MEPQAVPKRGQATALCCLFRVLLSSAVGMTTSMNATPKLGTFDIFFVPGVVLELPRAQWMNRDWLDDT